MGPSEATLMCLRDTLVYRRRAPAAEFWWFYASKTALVLIAGLFSGLAAAGVALALFPSTLAAGYRRLADADGIEPWLIFPIAMGLVVFQSLLPSGLIDALTAKDALTLAIFAAWAAISILAFTLLIRESEETSNKYGPNPHEVTP